jgi:hypothetical protein
MSQKRELGNEAPMVITPRALVRLFASMADAVRRRRKR